MTAKSARTEWLTDRQHTQHGARSGNAAHAIHRLSCWQAVVILKRGETPQKVYPMSKSQNQFLAIGGINSVRNAFAIECRFDNARKAMTSLLARLDELAIPHDVIAMVKSAQVQAETGTTMMHDLIEGIFDGSAFNHHGDCLNDAAWRKQKEEVATEVDLDALAVHIDLKQLAKHISASDIADEIDTEDIARHMDCEDIASHVDVSSIQDDIINDLDMSDLASHIDSEDLARHIDVSAVAAEIDMEDLAKDIARHIDHDDLAAEIRLQDLAQEIDIDRLASNIDLAKLSAALLKALSIVPSVMTLKVGETKPAFVND